MTFVHWLLVSFGGVGVGGGDDDDNDDNDDDDEIQQCV